LTGNCISLLLHVVYTESNVNSSTIRDFHFSELSRTKLMSQIIPGPGKLRKKPRTFHMAWEPWMTIVDKQTTKHQQKCSTASAQ